jgi:hypothetical protein
MRLQKLSVKLSLKLRKHKRLLSKTRELKLNVDRSFYIGKLKLKKGRLSLNKKR